MKKIGKIVVCGAISVIIMAIGFVNVTSAACQGTDRPFESYALPAYQGNNYTPYRTKQTSHTHSFVKTSSISQYPGATTVKARYWIHGKKIPSYSCRISGFVETGADNSWKTMNYSSKYSVPAGTTVRLGMESTKYNTYPTYVSGVVDYE